MCLASHGWINHDPMLEARYSNHLQLKGKSQTTTETTPMLLEW
jgi:hypothetical protein